MSEKTLSIRVGKIDLDTIGAAWILGVKSGDDVQVLRGNATTEDLADSSVICIEVGGSGQVEMNNFDHHGAGSEDLLSASFQALSAVACENQVTSGIVEYIDILDRKGPEEIRSFSSGAAPFLSDIVSGIFLTKRSPLEQLFEGIRFLEILNESQIDPFGSVKELVEKHSELAVYAEAHEQNKLMITKALDEAKWGETASGLKMAWLETSFFGAMGALYAHGAQVAVAFNPNMNGVRKFTVAGNGGIKVNSILPLLEAVENGWGGPGTGTILGSPKDGSNMSLLEVVEIVRENL